MQKTKYFVVDSRDRVTGTSSDFKVYVNPAVTAVNRISLCNVTFPNTVYNVNSNNNIIYFFEYVSSSTQLTATITPGAYNYGTLLTAIQTAMNAASVHSFTYTATYSATTFMITITSTGSFGLSFGTYTTNSIANIIGFTINTSNATSQTGNQVIQLYQSTFYYIDIREFPIATKSTNSLDYGTFVINTSVNSGNVEDWNLLNSYHQVQTYEGQNLQELNVRLRDRNNQILNLNGADWSMILEFKTKKSKILL